jgi:hypothetical protein
MDELSELKRLSGIAEQTTGSNISITGTEKKILERQLNIKPGTPEWFQLWFSLPKFMNGERAVGPGRRGVNNEV